MFCYRGENIDKSGDRSYAIKRWIIHNNIATGIRGKMGNSACALNLETDTTKVISANFVKCFNKVCLLELTQQKIKLKVNKR